MKPIYVYPGSFSPPTYGHLNIIKQAAAIFPEPIIICSENPDKKENWFSPEEGQKLWQSYALPKNVKVMTLAEFKTLGVKTERIVIIRGLRNMNDYEEEKKVIEFNFSHFGVNKYFYILSTTQHREISSSSVRENALRLNLKNLARQVSPLVISAVLEKALSAKNIFLVVGRTGAGKSTFLNMLEKVNPNNHWLNTDNFNKQLRPLLLEKFGGEDLIKLTLEDETKIKKVIIKPWFALLKKTLRAIPKDANIFVEVPYALQPDKLMFRFLGGKIIYVGGESEAQNLERVIKRGTPQLAEFIKKIPGRAETTMIAKKYRLFLSFLNTNCTLEELFAKTKLINNLISGGLKNVYDL